MRRNLFILQMLVLLAFATAPAIADLVLYSQITPTTSMTPNAAWPIAQISDGDVSNFNGFVSPDMTGTVQLTFTTGIHLQSFILHNDVNVFMEGIKDFRLDFFDELGAPIPISFNALYTGPQGQTAPQEYVFPTTVSGVKRVDLVILSVNVGLAIQTEIREVQFTAVPEPSSFAMIIVIYLGATLFVRPLRM